MSFPPDQVHLQPPAVQEAFFNGPALAPPDNTTMPNLEDPSNMNGLTHFCLAMYVLLSTGFMGLHYFARIFITKSMRMADYASIIAFGAAMGYIGYTYFLVVEQGYFVHLWDMSVNSLLDLVFVVFVCSQLYCVVLGIMKTIILLEWIRIFVPGGTRNGFFWTCWVFIVVNGLFYLIGFVLLHVASSPYERNYNFTIPGETHYDSDLLIVAGAAINVVLDIIVLIIPQRIIWKLNMSKQKKMGVSLIFMIGVFACVSAICRLAYSVVYYTSDDISYTVPAMSLWCMAEMTCAFVIYAAPSVPKALQWKSWRQKSTDQTPKESGSGYVWAATAEGTGHDMPRSRYKRIDEYGIPLTVVGTGEAEVKSHGVV